MTVKLVTLAFNSGRQAAMVDFYQALGANLQPRRVNKGSEAYFGTLGHLELVVYAIDRKAAVQSPDFSMRLEVSDIEAVMKRLRALPTAQVLMDIEMMPDGKQAVVLDPDGHSVELNQGWAGAGTDGR